MSAQTFFYVIAYDVTDDKRRRKLHNLLSGYCGWTQYSLFEGHLTSKERVALEEKLCRIIDEDEDSVRFYPLCADDVERVMTFGSDPPDETSEIII
jgi:CRISPR-associated protein Cas2